MNSKYTFDSIILKPGNWIFGWQDLKSKTALGVKGPYEPNVPVRGVGRANFGKWVTFYQYSELEYQGTATALEKALIDLYDAFPGTKLKRCVDVYQSIGKRLIAGDEIGENLLGLSVAEFFKHEIALVNNLVEKNKARTQKMRAGKKEIDLRAKLKAEQLIVQERLELLAARESIIAKYLPLYLAIPPMRSRKLANFLEKFRKNPFTDIPRRLQGEVWGWIIVAADQLVEGSRP